MAEEETSSDGLFTSFYDITRAIFRHLPIRSVESCALVCQSWAHMSRLTKQSRHTIHALTYPTDPTPDDLSPCLLQDFDAVISSYMREKLWSFPSFALIVTTNTLDEQGFLSSPGSPPRKACRRSCTSTAVARSRRLDTAEALMRHVNKSCPVLMVASGGIISSDDGDQSKETESGKYDLKTVYFVMGSFQAMPWGFFFSPNVPPMSSVFIHSNCRVKLDSLTCLVLNSIKCSAVCPRICPFAE